MSSNYTLTLEKALTDAFVLALQQSLQGALIVTAVENFESIQLPACFVKCTRKKESIINSAIYEFDVQISLVVQADDSDAMTIENLWASVLNVAFDIENLKTNLNAITPLYAFIFGILRDAPVTLQTSERHFIRQVSLTTHCGLLAS